MIYSQYWKDDFTKISKKIFVWHQITKFCDCGWTKHQLSKWILFSAVMVRKINEAEKRENDDLEELQEDGKFLWMPLDQQITNVKVRIYAREDVLDDNHFGRHQLKNEMVDISTICNKIIHDQDWIFWNDSNTNRVKGFAVSSQKGNAQYLISIKDWIKILLLCKNFYDN